MNSDLENTVAVLADCIGRAVEAMSDAGLVEQMDLVQVLRRQMDALELVTIRELDRRDLAREEGAKSLPVWLRRRHRIPTRAGSRKMKLARALDAALRATRKALVAGIVGADQAWVIKEAVEALPDKLDPQLAHKVETALVERAKELDPTDLRAAGAGILHELAPEVAQVHDRRRSADQERDARARRRLRFAPDGKGGVRMSALMDQQTAAGVRATVAQLARPLTRGAAGGPDQRSATQRSVDALATACELAKAGHETPNQLPGRPAVVPIDYERTTRELGIGTVDTGKRLPPELVRCIADQVHRAPAIPDFADQSVELDGERSLLTEPVWRMFPARNGECAAPGCSRPARWCDAHVRTPWAKSRSARVGGGVLLPEPRTLSVAQIAA